MYEKTKLWTVCDTKKAKPLIHQFTNLKYCKKAREPFKIPFLMVYQFLFITLKKHFKPCFFILKALKDILQHFKFVNWWIGGFVFLMSWTGYPSYPWWIGYATTYHQRCNVLTGLKMRLILQIKKSLNPKKIRVQGWNVCCKKAALYSRRCM